MHFRSSFTNWKLKPRINNGDLKSREIWIIFNDHKADSFKSITYLFSTCYLYLIEQNVLITMYKTLFCKHTCNFSKVMCSCVQFLNLNQCTQKLQWSWCFPMWDLHWKQEYLYFPGWFWGWISVKHLCSGPMDILSSWDEGESARTWHKSKNAKSILLS